MLQNAQDLICNVVTVSYHRILSYEIGRERFREMSGLLTEFPPQEEDKQNNQLGPSVNETTSHITSRWQCQKHISLQ